MDRLSLLFERMNLKAQVFYSGATPLHYLTDWRIGVAQSILKRGNALKMVATAVSYSNPAAFARAFSKRVGLSPTHWMAKIGV
ncbi:hypothetical protein os4_38590 (plasmid) [Comamonadaceae bacterium OS-4]|nr:hypothetical protein os4_38590 [Comamonadaceae bacterium OS-4]